MRPGFRRTETVRTWHGNGANRARKRCRHGTETVRTWHGNGADIVRSALAASRRIRCGPLARTRTVPAGRAGEGPAGARTGWSLRSRPGPVRSIRPLRWGSKSLGPRSLRSRPGPVRSIPSLRAVRTPTKRLSRPSRGQLGGPGPEHPACLLGLEESPLALLGGAPDRSSASGPVWRIPSLRWGSKSVGPQLTSVGPLFERQRGGGGFPRPINGRPRRAWRIFPRRRSARILSLRILSLRVRGGRLARTRSVPSVRVGVGGVGPHGSAVGGSRGRARLVPQDAGNPLQQGVGRPGRPRPI